MGGQKKSTDHKSGDKTHRSSRHRSRRDGHDQEHRFREHHESEEVDHEYLDAQDPYMAAQNDTDQHQRWMQHSTQMTSGYPDDGTAGVDPQYHASYSNNGHGGYAVHPSTQFHAVFNHVEGNDPYHGVAVQDHYPGQGSFHPQQRQDHALGQQFSASRASTWGSNGSGDSTGVYNGSVQDDDGGRGDNPRDPYEQREQESRRVGYFMQQATGVPMPYSSYGRYGQNDPYDQGEEDEGEQQPEEQDQRRRRQHGSGPRRERHGHGHRERERDRDRERDRRRR